MSAASLSYETWVPVASPGGAPFRKARRANGRPAVSSIEPPTKSPNRILGPARSVKIPTGRPLASSAWRTASATARRDAGVPCEKLIRATSIPATTSSSITLLGRRPDRADKLCPSGAGHRTRVAHHGATVAARTKTSSTGRARGAGSPRPRARRRWPEPQVAARSHRPRNAPRRHPRPSGSDGATAR